MRRSFTQKVRTSKPGNLYVKRVEMLNIQKEEKPYETEQEASETPLIRPVRAHRQICQTLCRAYCPSLAHHLNLVAAHAFTLATGSHASVAGWNRPICVPCRQFFLVCLL